MSRKFTVTVNGFDFDASDEDMPTEVRLYVEELCSQLAEEGGTGRVELLDTCIPPEIDAYFKRRIRERILESAKRAKEVKLGEVSADRIWKIMDGAIEKSLGTVLAYAGTKRAAEEARKMAFYLRAAFRLTVQENEDWRKLGARDGAMLFDGFVTAMLFAASQYSEIADMTARAGQEEDDDAKQDK